MLCFFMYCCSKECTAITLVINSVLNLLAAGALIWIGLWTYTRDEWQSYYKDELGEEDDRL